jgi:hypothetical protein
MVKCPKCEESWTQRRNVLRTELRTVRTKNSKQTDITKHEAEPKPERKPDYTTVCVRSIKGQDPINTFDDGSNLTHHHDPNIHIDTFTCSKGHRFTVVYSCPCWCGWQTELPPETNHDPAPDAHQH